MREGKSKAAKTGQTHDLSAPRKSSCPKPRSLGNERENTPLVEVNILPDEKASESTAYCSLPCHYLDPTSRLVPRMSPCSHPRPGARHLTPELGEKGTARFPSYNA